MTECPMCYRRERRELGLCLKCDKRTVHYRHYRKMSPYCADHLKSYKPRKKRPVKKHVLDRAKFLNAKKMIAAGALSMRSIGELVGVSERTIRRVANGEYDSHFKTTAKRNAAAVG